IALVVVLGGSVITEDQSAANSTSIDLTALATSFAARNAVFRTPNNLPTTAFLRLRLTTAISSGSSLFIDDLVLAPMTEVYTDGVWAIGFTGIDNWGPSDTATITATNDRAGKMHEWFNRVFDLRENRLLLPSAAY